VRRLLARAKRGFLRRYRKRLPLRLWRPFFAPARELRRIEHRYRRTLADPSLEIVGPESHQPVLLELLAQLPQARMLELGTGFASTPIVLGRAGRSVSLETDEWWLRRFGRFASSEHQILLWRDFTDSEWNCPYFADEWDVALIDNLPGRSRQSNLLKLAHQARFIVCHDTEGCFKPSAADYRWDFSGFEYGWTFTRYPTYTTVVSTVEPIPLGHLGGVDGTP
jgi:hypothetical protein